MHHKGTHPAACTVGNAAGCPAGVTLRRTGKRRSNAAQQRGKHVKHEEVENTTKRRGPFAQGPNEKTMERKEKLKTLMVCATCSHLHKKCRELKPHHGCLRSRGAAHRRVLSRSAVQSSYLILSEQAAPCQIAVASRPDHFFPKCPDE